MNGIFVMIVILTCPILELKVSLRAFGRKRATPSCSLINEQGMKIVFVAVSVLTALPDNGKETDSAHNL